MAALLATWRPVATFVCPGPLALGLSPKLTVVLEMVVSRAWAGCLSRGRSARSSCLTACLHRCTMVAAQSAMTKSGATHTHMDAVPISSRPPGLQINDGIGDAAR
eukprot:scaffold2462_cov402-Prasinococcus_capsulatus_cf.AAC.11